MCTSRLIDYPDPKGVPKRLHAALCLVSVLCVPQTQIICILMLDQEFMVKSKPFLH